MGLLSRLFGGKKSPAPPTTAATASSPAPAASTSSASSPAPRAEQGSTQDMDTATKERIEKLIGDNRVLLFMKGDRIFPQCGFSAATIEILKSYDVPFETVDVLSDPAIRQTIKEFSEWPTIPQLYVAGEFLGGCDIVREMHSKNELAGLLQEKPAAS